MAAQDATKLVRGYPERLTDLMEHLQIGYLRAVAAAAGCLVSDPNLDDGIDCQLNHRSDSHTTLGDQTARLEVQLKSTTQRVGAQGTIGVQVTRKRWDYLRSNPPTVHKIVVIMSLPPTQDAWVLAGEEALELRHCAYWVSPIDLPASEALEPTVSAPRSQVFDDVALCGIMSRIGQGGKP